MESDGDFNMIKEELENIATGKLLWSRDKLMKKDNLAINYLLV